MGDAYQRGLVLYQQTNYTMAEQEFRRELSQEPNSCEAHAMLGLSLSLMDRASEAFHEANLAVVANPLQAIGHYAVAISLIRRIKAPGPGRVGQMYRHNLKCARAPLMEALRLSPTNAHYMGTMSAIELDLGNELTALEWADCGLGQQPDNLWCAQMRSTVLRSVGMMNDARGTARQALSVDPEYSGTHATQGWNMLYSGEYQQAMEHFTEAARLDPTNWRIIRGLRLATGANKPVVGPFVRARIRIEGTVGREALMAAALFGTVPAMILFLGIFMPSWSNVRLDAVNVGMIGAFGGIIAIIFSHRPVQRWNRRRRVRKYLRRKDRTARKPAP
jgi:tetratricopeptide (TPR) repeat protein